MTHSQRTKSSETLQGRRSFLKLLGLGGAAAAATAVGSTALGGTIKKVTEEENKGTLWKTETFDDGVVRMRADAVKLDRHIYDSFVIKDPKEDGWAPRTAPPPSHRDFDPKNARVVTLRTMEECLEGHSKPISVFGRKVKLGDLIQFKGQDEKYTVIEVIPGKNNNRYEMLLDRPLVFHVDDLTAVFGVGRRSLMRSGGRLCPGEILIEQGGQSVRVTGGLTVSYSAHREYGRLDSIRMGYEQPLDIDIEAYIETISPAVDIQGLLHSGEKSAWDTDPCEPASFRVTAPGPDGSQYVFTKCYWNRMNQDMMSGALRISGRCMQAEVTHA